ncbi:hypothetical protein GCM10011321_01460 [Youhaiella tibetensis]|nr:hypothetical protein GCM10011321_01460 [Youhaiella tibetensis]
MGVGYQFSASVTPLPASPARREAPIAVVGRFVVRHPDRNTSPAAGEVGRGVCHHTPAYS